MPHVKRHTFGINVDQYKHRTAGPVLEIFVGPCDHAGSLRQIKFLRPSFCDDLNGLGQAGTQGTERDSFVASQVIDDVCKFREVIECGSPGDARRHHAGAAIAKEFAIFGEADPLCQRAALFGEPSGLD